MIYIIFIYVLSGLINYWFFYKSFMSGFIDLLLADALYANGMDDSQLNYMKRVAVVTPIFNTYIALHIIKNHA